mmetsp:Transcript_22402/g.49608  ORF Transcript_22402/g.49608 Transcript_22402/m.49608 type:complete len:702 (+) Transcript_22402:78-2183(+)
MPPVIDLPLAAERAAFGLLRTVADEEVKVEACRQRLCSMRDFYAHQAFSAIMGCKIAESEAALGASQLQRWLADQQHKASSISYQECLELLEEVSVRGRFEMSYSDFLRLVLPRERKEVLGKNTDVDAHCRTLHFSGSPRRMSAEVKSRLCDIMLAEVSLLRQQINAVIEVRRYPTITPGVLRSLLCADQETATEEVVAGFLQSRQDGLSDVQCKALLRRLTVKASGQLQAAKGPWRLELKALEKMLLLSSGSFKEEYQYLAMKLPGFGNHTHARRSVWEAHAAKQEPSVASPRPVPRLLKTCPTSSLAPAPVGRRSEETDLAGGQQPQTANHAGKAQIQESALPAIHTLQLAEIEAPLPHKDVIMGFNAASVKLILTCLAKQGELEVCLENVRRSLPAGLPVEAVFENFDRYEHGYVAEGDLWRFSHDFGAPAAPYVDICTLVSELRLIAMPPHDRQPTLPKEDALEDLGLDSAALPGRLSLRALSLLFLSPGTLVRRKVLGAMSDDEVRSRLYVLRHTVPCCGCGADVQRSSDAFACPVVQCPVCGAAFECLVVEPDEQIASSTGFGPLHKDVATSVAKLIAVGAAAARSVEDARQLAAGSSYASIAQALALDDSSAKRICADVYSAICPAGGLGISMSDLRRAFVEHGIWVAEKELQHVWTRYAGAQGCISLATWTRHLMPTKPLNVAMHTGPGGFVL